MNPDRTIICVTQDQISSEFKDGEMVILSLEDGVYYGLNPVGAFIWNLIQEPTSFREIIQNLVDEYNVEVTRCERETWAIIAELKAKGLVEIQYDAAE